MPSVQEILTFDDSPPPPGASPWVEGAGPAEHVEVEPPDHAWELWFDTLSGRIRRALGWRALAIEHVGSTAVPGLPAKPIIDIDLIVANPDDEAGYVPALEDAGFELRVREPWWYRHRVLRHPAPACHLHVFGYDSPEPARHRLFRDWLRANSSDRELYSRAKREAAERTLVDGGDMRAYNAHKQAVVREIYQRAFAAAGLLETPTAPGDSR